MNSAADAPRPKSPSPDTCSLAQARRRTLRRLAAAALLLPQAGRAGAEPSDHWIYPLPSDGDRERYGFEFALLQAALQASADPGQTVDLRWSPQTMTPARARIEVAAGHLSVVHSYSTPEVELLLNAVPFAMDRGLHSQRILLTRRELLPALARARHREDLKPLRFGVLGSWSDRQTLQEQGFKTEVTESFAGLFKMLTLSRSDVIMCSVLHVAQLTPWLAEYPALLWEPTLLLTVPSEQRFYTARNPEGEARAARLLRGLKLLQHNGEFDRLHERFFGQAMRLSKNRRPIALV